MKLKKWFATGVFLLASLIFVQNIITEYPPKTNRFVVSRVIDGDTIEIGTGDRVRLIGINAPERGQYLYEESSDYLRGLIGEREVELESDVEDMDRYNRLLRYVFVNDTFINAEMVRRGYAFAYIIPPNEKYSTIIIRAEEEAKRGKRGVWKLERDNFCIAISEFNYNAKGNDNENLNDEYVTFRNRCNKSVDLDGWYVRDESGKEYRFRRFVLQPGEDVTLHSGSGEDTDSDLYWNSNRAIWNNNGDRLLLYDNENNILLDYRY